MLTRQELTGLTAEEFAGKVLEQLVENGALTYAACRLRDLMNHLQIPNVFQSQVLDALRLLSNERRIDRTEVPRRQVPESRGRTYTRKMVTVAARSCVVVP